jgi:NO-binding membrane sensor protein with MHYT domain
METQHLSAALEHHHFTYGWLTPAMGFAFAAAGSFLGLSAARRARARAAATVTGRVRWALLSALAVGGIGVWTMHFIAMIGFTVAGSRIAYDVKLTAASFALAVLAVGCGAAVAGTGRAGWPRLALGGLVCGAGVVGMHYTGMAAMSVSVEVGRPVVGADPLTLMLPVLMLAALAIVGSAFGVLNAPNPEYWAGGTEPTVRLANATRL